MDTPGHLALASSMTARQLFCGRIGRNFVENGDGIGKRELCSRR